MLRCNSGRHATNKFKEYINYRKFRAQDFVSDTSPSRCYATKQSGNITLQVLRYYYQYFLMINPAVPERNREEEINVFRSKSGALYEWGSTLSTGFINIMQVATTSMIDITFNEHSFIILYFILYMMMRIKFYTTLMNHAQLPITMSLFFTSHLSNLSLNTKAFNIL